MRIACLQFAPVSGDVDNNLNRADSVLNRSMQPDHDGLDLLVLPELAFSGSKFRSLQDISPFLEHSGSGISSLWARTTALKYNCNVVVGYPEKVDMRPKWPTSPEYYNSSIVVSSDGETIANYRKCSLWPEDEKWALEGQDGFFEDYLEGIGTTVMGISADIIRSPQEPDMDSLTCWVQRLEPLIKTQTGEEVIVIFCNRSGTESGQAFAGTSAILGIKDGEVSVYGLLGRGVKDVLMVDTNHPPIAKLTQHDAEVASEPRKPAEMPKASEPPSRKTILHQRPPSPGLISSQLSPGLVPDFASAALLASTMMAPPGDLRAEPAGQREKSAVSLQVPPLGKYSSRGGSESPKKPPSPKAKSVAPKLQIPTSQFSTAIQQSISPAVDSPDVATPICPSPTPQDMRPFFATTPSSAHSPMQSRKHPYISSGTVKVITDYRTPTNPTTPFLEFFRNISPSSPKSPTVFQCSPLHSPKLSQKEDNQLYWVPPRKMIASPIEPPKPVETPNKIARADTPLDRMLSMFAMPPTFVPRQTTSSPVSIAVVKSPGPLVPEKPKRKPRSTTPASVDSRPATDGFRKARMRSSSTKQQQPPEASSTQNRSQRDDAKRSLWIAPPPKSRSQNRSQSVTPMDTSPAVAFPEPLNLKNPAPRSRSAAAITRPFESPKTPVPSPPLKDEVVEKPVKQYRPCPRANSNLGGRRAHSASRVVTGIKSQGDLPPLPLAPSSSWPGDAPAAGEIARPTSRRGHETPTQQQTMGHRRSQSLSGPGPASRDAALQSRPLDPSAQRPVNDAESISGASRSNQPRGRSATKSPPILQPATSLDTPRGRSIEQRSKPRARKRTETPGTTSSSSCVRHAVGSPAGIDPDEIIATISKLTDDCPYHKQGTPALGTVIRSADGSLYTIELPQRVQDLAMSILQNPNYLAGASLNRRQSAVW
ncbi:hypothetical protein PpBr36_05080 [Pyricularia pennisetigena]|uniref:hypothetical protein n=1 Tax=Pyricularia pennisetigena TaxID=1578925 RepID=UPI00114E1373|nr:hypothetical protein PpBr36_05080 [Pyricularia pennisetigena]TLS26361.1 hypothetical protein PpBr36_05080 [Pyricularia pennisetigena]